MCSSDLSELKSTILNAHVRPRTQASVALLLAKMAELADYAEMSDCVENVNVEETSNFYDWLKGASLEKHHKRLAENGITEVSHLEDVKEDEAELLRLTKFDYRRLARLYTQFKRQSQNSVSGETANKPAFKTSDASVVMTVPKGMKEFL